MFVVWWSVAAPALKVSNMGASDRNPEAVDIAVAEGVAEATRRLKPALQGVHYAACGERRSTTAPSAAVPINSAALT